MADNTTLNTMTGGDVIASDDIGGVKHQRVKVEFGVDGAATDASATNPFPITLISSTKTIDTTTTLLGIGASYTSPTFDHSVGGTFMTHYIYADVGGTHYHEVSHDGTNWQIADSEVVTGGTPLFERHEIMAKYSRMRYVNGGTAQATFYHQGIQKFWGSDEYIKIDSNQNSIQGSFSPNAGSSGASNIGTLPAIASNSAQAYTDTYREHLLVKLNGDLVITLDGETVALGAGSASIGVLGANSGVDIGDVTINNAAGAAAVNIQDGGNSITIDNANLDVLLSTRLKPADTLAGVTTVAAVTAITNALPAGTNIMGKVGIDQTTPGTTNKVSLGSDSITVNQATAANLNVQNQGNVAHAGADAGNPIKVGGKAKTTQPTAVTDAQRTDATYDKMGRQVVVLGHIRDLISLQQTTIASSSAETTIITAVASEFHDIASLVITNASATAVTVTIKDATAGTTRYIIDLAANGGAVICPAIPIPQLAAVNNNWTATLSNATTTVHITAQFVKNL